MKSNTRVLLVTGVSVIYLIFLLGLGMHAVTQERTTTPLQVWEVAEKRFEKQWEPTRIVRVYKFQVGQEMKCIATVAYNSNTASLTSLGEVPCEK